MKVLHYGLRCVSEVYPFRKGIAKLFKSVLKFHSTLKAMIFVIPSLMITITLHSSFRIFLCVNNMREVMVYAGSKKSFVEKQKFIQEKYQFCKKVKVQLGSKQVLLKCGSLAKEMNMKWIYWTFEKLKEVSFISTFQTNPSTKTQ